jgi:hypothetical protein
MHIRYLVPLIALSATTVADHFNVLTRCGGKDNYCERYGVWYYFDPYLGVDTFFRPTANDGCQGLPRYEYTELCMDWNNKRGHYMHRERGRRCLLQRGQINVKPGLDLSAWEEVGCTW